MQEREPDRSVPAGRVGSGSGEADQGLSLGQIKLGDEGPDMDPLTRQAFQLAESHAIARRPKRIPAISARLREQESLLRQAYQYFATASEAQRTLNYAAEWLLDNYYIVQQAVRQIGEDMPESYYRQLPKLGASSLEGYPRVYALALGMIAFCGSHLSLDRVTLFVQAYQQVAPLAIGELWALPTMLRVGIIEGLAGAVAEVTGLGARRDEARPGTVSHPQEQGAEEIVGNCILSLRSLAAHDWQEFFESVSRVEAVLRSDPANVYERMDFDPRDRYRKVVEELARTAGRSEERVAREAVWLAKRASDEAPATERPERSTHVGYYLLDRGRVQLETRLDYAPSWRAGLRRRLLDHPTPTYLGAIGLAALIMLIASVWYAQVAGGAPGHLVAVGLLVLVPATAAAVSLVNWLVTILVPPRVLPRLEFEDGIPAEYSTMLVVPAILKQASEIEPLLKGLELHFLSNEDRHLALALLTDFGDAPEQQTPDDGELLAQLEDGIVSLNRKYGRRGSRPFYLFHRDREWNPAEDCWMGWERKRGKLVEFNRLLGGSKDTSYRVQIGDLKVLARIRYVITVDADTVVPRGAARRLVATLAHPLNRAELDPDSGQVVAGYTVLQPRVEVKPTSASRSLFTHMFAGDTGLDLYTLAVSDVYQDLFGEGSYVGKGIYDVAAFEQSLRGRIPDNALLSHDLFEGIHGRAGLVTDVILYEDYPPHYLAYAHRLHRWVRGDWQLAPWVLPKAPRADGGRRRNDLSPVDRWKILDNLRRSVTTPALLALLISGWLWLPGSPLLWTLGGLAASAAPLITRIVTRLVKAPLGVSLRWDTPSLRAGIGRWLLGLSFALFETLLMLDAIATTLVRMTITRKRLLQWTTAAHTIRLFGQEKRLAIVWKHMGGVPVLALLLIMLITILRPAALPAAAPLLLAWLTSLGIAAWIDRPLVHEQAPLPADDRQKLRSLARRTWYFFERFVGPEDHWLPPDHFQEDPRGLVAHRTSPTNIGLLLLSTLAAYDLGYIGLMDLVLRLNSTFDGMRELEQYRGHFLNWYETSSLEPLPPRYVSTVDSGNLAGCLVALKQGCLALPLDPVFRWQTWQGLLDALDVMLGIVDEVKRYPTRASARPVGDGDGDADPGQKWGDLETAAASLEAHIGSIQLQVLEVADNRARWVPLLVDLADSGWTELDRLLVLLVDAGSQFLNAATLRGLRISAERVFNHLQNTRSALDLLLPWLLPLDRPPALFDRPGIDPAIADAWRALQDALPIAIAPHLDQVPAICAEGLALLDRLRELLDPDTGAAGQADLGPDEAVHQARAWCESLAQDLSSARMVAEGLSVGCHSLGERAEACFEAMDFGFLFDSQRQVFHLGYNVAVEKLDGNHYDLLASEARIASLLAIAKGEVPSSHWLHLARPITRINRTRALLSWNGSMFEYLMPPLLMRHYEGTLLDHTNHAVVQHQIDYGRRKGVPWGISEAGYYGFDAHLNYQYRGFGVPGLGFKRGLGDDLVISPYASLLALSVRPHAVMQNIAHLTELGMVGAYGFYEAIDYTRSRLSLGEESGLVRSFMAHHQGMILLALTNYLGDGAMVRRFHADPRVQSVELLLQEQVPEQVPLQVPHPGEAAAFAEVQPRPGSSPWRASADAPLPQVHFLSNGRYGLMITGAGAGFSRWRDVDLTRWRADTTLDNWGTWLYVQDMESGRLWSAGLQPTGSVAEGQEVQFYAHMAEFHRWEDNISLRMEITIAPSEDVEVRLITLTNHDDRPRCLMLVSYSEVVLAPQASDRRHPAFNKLFIESEYLPGTNSLLFRRRPRSVEEEAVFLAHMAIVEPGRRVTGAHESDRARFLGRGGTTRAPAALGHPASMRASAKAPPALLGLSGTTGATLDPIMALAQEVTLEPHAKAQVAFVTLAAGSRPRVLALAHRYQSFHLAKRSFDLARASSERELQELELTVPEVEQYQRLLSVLLYPHAALRAEPATLAKNCKGQAGLWPLSISGDHPILLVRVGSQDDTALVGELCRAHAYWRNRRLQIDLVILNLQDSSYSQELQNRLHRLVARTGGDAWLNRRGGIFLVRSEQVSKVDRVLLETAARAVLDGENGPLARQLVRLDEQPIRLPPFVSTLVPPKGEEPIPPPVRPTNLLFDNGLGGFSLDGREYVIYLEPGQWTPAPWINVIANQGFGFLVSEAGAGYTWAENSGENRLTPWRNDPLTDAPGEALYLRDEEVGDVWSPTRLPAGPPTPSLIRHGAGYSIFEQNSHGLKQSLRLFAAPDAPVKVIGLRLENTWRRNRRITATYYVEWVLGTTRDVHQPYIVPEFDAKSHALLARNAYNEEFGDRVAFLAASKEPYGLTTDRTEFLGRGGCPSRPAALRRGRLTGTVRAGLDPCAALQIHVWLAAGETEEVFFLLGQGADREEALQLVEKHRDPAQVEAEWQAVNGSWDQLLGTVSVQTPDPALDLLLNRWLLYQALSCRIWDGPRSTNRAARLAIVISCRT